MTGKLRGPVAASVVVVVLLWAAVGPASASDVNLGSPTTMDELVASPEYREEHSQVARLYQAFFSRTPDVAGLIYWIDQYENGVPMGNISEIFATSVEFQNTYGASLTDEEFLEIVYGNVLGRSYDVAGYNYWLSEMKGGLSRALTVMYVGLSDEFRNNFPFAPTGPDYSQAFLTPQDMGSGWADFETGQFNVTFAEKQARTGCFAMQSMPTNSLWSQIHKLGTYEWVYQELYAYSDEADAIAYMDQYRRYLIQCPSWFHTFSDGTRVEFRNGPHLDAFDPIDVDEAFQFNGWIIFEDGRIGETVYFYRIGSVIMSLWFDDSPGQPNLDTTDQYSWIAVDKLVQLAN